MPFFFHKSGRGDTFVAKTLAMPQQDHHIHINPKYRWIENGHIFLWLIKDTCWALEYKVGGILMIFPTITVAFYILWKSRRIRSELFHNIAVCLWITANSIWMVGEFFERDMRIVAAGLFTIGLSLLLYYYIRFFRKDQKIQQDYTLSITEEDSQQPVLAEVRVND